MRYLGLDIGERHVGVAVGELLASELSTLNAPKDQSFYRSPELAYDLIAQIVATEQADAIVIGIPTNENDQLSAEAASIKKFGNGLSDYLDKTIHFVNETLTSFMAADILEGQGLSVEAARKREHQLAAQLILQQFLEDNANS